MALDARVDDSVLIVFVLFIERQTTARFLLFFFFFNFFNIFFTSLYVVLLSTKTKHKHEN